MRTLRAEQNPEESQIEKDKENERKRTLRAEQNPEERQLEKDKTAHKN
jgi:hypothetical protein